MKQPQTPQQELVQLLRSEYELLTGKKPEEAENLVGTSVTCLGGYRAAKILVAFRFPGSTRHTLLQVFDGFFAKEERNPQTDRPLGFIGVMTEENTYLCLNTNNKKPLGDYSKELAKDKLREQLKTHRLIH